MAAGMFDNVRSGVANASDAAHAASEATVAQRRVAELEDQLDRLTLVCAAVWELVKERAKLTEDDLAQRVAILDVKDGVADGKFTHGVRPCQKCNRPVSARHRKCLYCGAEQVVDGVFQSL